MARSALVLVVIALASVPTSVSADECTSPAKVTWGAAAERGETKEEGPVARARDLLGRAKFLDDAAALDDKTVTDLTNRLPAMRLAAKVARDRADRATNDEMLAARAEELEAEITVSEAEIVLRKKSAVDNRRVARDLRARAVRLVREAPQEEAIASSCDPPFRFTSDGRKVYRIECFR